MAVAFVALFVAGAGGAIAAGPVITGKDIKNNSITGKDVKNRSLLAKDFKRGQIPRGATGSQGPQGIAGPAGRAGRDGTDGFGELVYSQGIGDLTPNAATGDDVFAVCPPGTFPTGGGAFYVDDDDNFLADQPLVRAQGIAVDSNNDPVAWFGTPVTNDTGDGIKLVVDAICANADTVGFISTPQAKAKRDELRPMTARP